MAEVIVNKSINIAADKAWEALSSFKGIENYSPIESSVTEGTGAGAKRTCLMPDGAAIYEVLNFTNDEDMQMQYKIVEGPFPVTNYVSNIKIDSSGPNVCSITWDCDFQSSDEVREEMKKLFGGFYEIIITNLEKHLKN